MFVDIHTHQNSFPDFPAIRSLSPSEALNQSEINPRGLFSAGLHPWYIDESSNEQLKTLEFLLQNNRIVFVGECGLDKNRSVPLSDQIPVFRTQIQLSEKFEKPLIIHCVGCFNELISLKKELNPTQKWIIHGFRGKPELAKQLLSCGFDLSFGEHFNTESVRVTSVERIYCETDESRLNIEDIYLKIAEIKNCKPESLKAGYNLFNQISALL